MTPSLRIGVSGWNSDFWADQKRQHGPNHAKLHPLARVASRFDTAEIKQTFDSHLRPEVARLWVRQVEENPDFQFTAKLHRQFSHERLLDPAAIAEWKAGLEPLRKSKRLGAVLMQFPWSFRFSRENREHVLALRRNFAEFPLVAEFRHESWTLDEALGTLIDYKIGFCNIDQPDYVRAMPPTSFLTSATGYVRLHGRNSFGFYSGSATARYDYEYSHDELDAWSNRIDHLRTHCSRTFVVANNDAGPKAAATAHQLQQRLGSGVPGGGLVLVESKRAVQAPIFGSRRVA